MMPDLNKKTTDIGGAVLRLSSFVTRMQMMFYNMN